MRTKNGRINLSAKFSLILMVLNIEIGLGGEANARARSVFTNSGFTICLGALEQLGLASLDLVVLASPGTEDRGLEGAAIRESECPRLLGSGAGVNGVKVNGGIFLSLATRKEGNAGNGSRHGPAEGGDGGDGNLFWGVFLGALLASSYHVGLEESTFQVNVVVVESLVHECQYSLSNFLGALQVVLTIGKNLGFNDWDESVHLANGSIAGEDVGILQHGLVAGGVLADLEYTSPLGEVAAILLVLGAPGRQVIKTLGGGLSLRSH